MIDTIIFDLGGVLVDLHPIEGMRKIGFSEKAVEEFENKIFSGLWEECDNMDGGIISYELGLVKPDDKIYKALMEKYNIVPERAVFIDDREENVQAARALGIKGIIFENYEQARRELARVCG